jgi:hypothetical protein
MRSMVVSVVLVFAMVDPAAAQTAASPLAAAAPSAAAPTPVPAAPPRYEEPSELVALSLSLSTAAVSYTLLGIGIARREASLAIGSIGAVGLIGAVFAPSSGRWYAGSSGLGGIGLRLLAVGLVAQNRIATSLCECDRRGNERDIDLLGAAVFFGSSIYDLVSTDREIRRSNREHRSSVKLLPLAPLGRPEVRGYGFTVVGEL